MIAAHLGRIECAALAVALLLASASAAAQNAGCVRLAATPTVPAQGWAPPLDRPVSLQVRDVALRDALDRLAATAAVRLSYSPDLLPLERRVCADFAAVALGGALSELLAGTGVEARVIGGEQVALAPVPGDSPATTTARTTVLEQVVVTGSAAGGAPERALSVGLTVIPGAEIRRRAAGGAIADVFDGAVPGLWMWDQPPTSLLARYASVRGASSFGVSYPKVYIDGIEMASPLLLSRIDPEMIERIEVIRGPQGAALYGTDAIAGVVNIVTRTAGASVGEPRIGVHGSFGVAASDYVARPPVTQEYGASFRDGSSARAVTLGLTAGGTGAYMLGAYDRHLGATASTRVVGTKTIVTAMARLQLADAVTPTSPILLDSVRSGSDRTLPRQVADQYTVGATMRVMQSERVTHTLVLGVDGYRLSGVGIENTPIPSAADSAIRAANGGADRATLRASTTGTAGSDALAASITLAGEESVLRSQTGSETSPSSSGSGASGPGWRIARSTSSPRAERTSGYSGSGGDRPANVSWRSNTGLIAQGTASLRDVAYLTAGVRFEENAGFLGALRWTTLPMLGLSVVGGTDGMRVKLRGAYGKGIRPPRNASRESEYGTGSADVERFDLLPESQSGIELGADVYLGSSVALRVTRFDQAAVNLIQAVVMSDGGRTDSTYGPHRYGYRFENVGRILNRGWELEGSVVRGPLTLGSTFTTTLSTVDAIASGYGGELMRGDTLLEVPRYTGSVNAAWTAPRWSASLGFTRVLDWRNYDRLGLAAALVATTTPLDPAQLQDTLRRYTKWYPGVNRLRATFSRDLTHGYALTIAGENLLNVQTGEPDNITIVPGRTVRVGVRTEF